MLETVCKLFVSQRNSLNHVTILKQMTIIEWK